MSPTAITPEEAIALLRVRQQQARYDLIERQDRERIYFLDRQRREIAALALQQYGERQLVLSAVASGHA